MIFYNEFNPESAAMIRQFMQDGLIPKGVVDERSITEIEPDELKRYTQCHFFAGIAGWTFALQLAGWDSDRPVWTGSCPCQPFSSAGRQRGKEDDRHLWPVWERLIGECRPATVYGEQVSSAITHGWLDDVYQGLEKAGYAVGSAVLPAVCVGAPHRRERLWFVGQLLNERTGGTSRQDARQEERLSALETERNQVQESAQSGEVRIEPDPNINGRDQERSESSIGGDGAFGVVNTIPNAEDTEREQRGKARAGRNGITGGSPLHNSFQSRLEGHGEPREKQIQERREGSEERHDLASNPWHTGIWIDCLDGKKRLVEPSIFPLVDGFQHRRPILHAAGNAIVSQAAAAFIKATMT